MTSGPEFYWAAFLVNLTTTGTVTTSLAIALGDTLEASDRRLPCVSVCRRPQRHEPLARHFQVCIPGRSGQRNHRSDVRRLEPGVGRVPQCTMTHCGYGGPGGLATRSASSLLRRCCCFGIQILLCDGDWPLSSRPHVCLFVSLAIGLIVFSDMLVSGTRNYPLEFLCVPFLIWAASRFGQREAALATLVLSVPAIWGTLHGFGPFAGVPKNDSLILMQAFLGVGAVMTMGLASEVAVRRRAERDAQVLAGMDQADRTGELPKADRHSRTGNSSVPNARTAHLLLFSWIWMD